MLRVTTMQTHLHDQPKIKAWNADPDASGVIMASLNPKASESLRIKAHRMKQGLQAIAIANRECAEVQERWHALVNFDDRSNPIKFVAMTRTEALDRNATIRDLRMEWVMRDR